MPVAFRLKAASKIPLHRQIYDEWREGILDGRFRRGERVPSTRELAASLGVARATVSAAYEQLAAEGYFESAHGSGTFVCGELPDQLPPARRSAPPRPGPAPEIRLSRFGAGLVSDYPAPLSLAPGWIGFPQWRPDLSQFPFALWRRLMARHLRGATPELFDYAGAAAGYPPLRREIAAYLARSRAVRCKPEDVIVVNGSQQALDLCARLLIDPGDEVALEDPCYQGARRIFSANGARIQPVPVDGEGLDPSGLGAHARLVYVTPSHQFPSGVSLSVARRLELIEWARWHDAAIVEDDYDSEYRFSGSPLPAMQGLAANAPVIYVGTFSKVMFPGLRVGYVVAPSALVAAFTRAKWLADRHTPFLEQAALADFLSEGHLQRHIRRMRRLYGRRREVLVEALARHFGTGAQVLGDEAGMHVLVRFDDLEVLARAAAQRVHLASSAPYYLTPPPDNEFILGFSGVNERTIKEGVRRMARA
jgi:GntR family transcriptional regulator/MocR family aminotransferase